MVKRIFAAMQPMNAVACAPITVVLCLQGTRQERDTRQENPKATQPCQRLTLHTVSSLLQSGLFPLPVQVERALDHPYSLRHCHGRLRYHCLSRWHSTAAAQITAQFCDGGRHVQQ